MSARLLVEPSETIQRFTNSLLADVALATNLHNQAMEKLDAVTRQMKRPIRLPSGLFYVLVSGLPEGKLDVQEPEVRARGPIGVYESTGEWAKIPQEQYDRSGSIDRYHWHNDAFLGKTLEFDTKQENLVVYNGLRNLRAIVHVTDTINIGQQGGPA